MRIHNRRYGFATNSSSSHSVIALPGGRFLSDREDPRGEYGWEPFTLASHGAKRSYVAAQLAHALLDSTSTYGSELTSEDQAFIQRFTGVELPATNWGYVDHQSVWCLPRNWNGERLDESFLQALLHHIDEPNVAILGGNDNGGRHPNEEDGTSLRIPEERSNESLVCRHDDPFWTLFDRRTGTKTRLSFGEEPGYYKAQYPELVDIKITDFCPYNCGYCYQGSTEQGNHASLKKLRDLAEVLADVRTFEVALGGGEPTMHPDFGVVVRLFREAGIIPNFTTRNLKWVADPANRDIIRACGGFAFSVDRAATIAAVATAVQGIRTDIAVANGHGPQVSIQYVVGTASDDEFERIIAACAEAHLGLTLLGYKDTGRGEIYRIGDEGRVQTSQAEIGWLDLIERMREEDANFNTSKAADVAWRHRVPRISIDTALARIAEPEMKKREIATWAYSKIEGAFSMYIDAVSNFAGPSSYVSQLVPMETSRIPQIFASFPGELP